MAEKIARPGASAPPVAPTHADEAQADDLAILHPDREIVLAGRAVTVREYGFVEGLKLHAIAQPFFDALYASCARTGDTPSFVDVEQVLVEHSECVLELIAKACDVEVEWIHSLSDEDGYLLMQQWWLANAGFFIRRVVQRLATEGAKARRRAGRVSMPPSSVPDSGKAQPTSDASPPGK